MRMQWGRPLLRPPMKVYLDAPHGAKTYWSVSRTEHSPILAACRVVARGFTIVVLTAANVYQVAHAHYLGAFVVGMAISIVWYSNAKTTARSDVPYAGLLYGLGAGIGTITGMFVMRMIYG
jgi:hypothetical protein